MDFEKNIPEIEKRIGYRFSDKSLLRQAFTRTSFCNEKKSRTGAPYQSNEVLEFFGDSVLSAAIITLLLQDFSERYEHGIFTDLGEGDFSNIKSRLSDKKNLSRATASLGLQEFLIMGEGDAKLGIKDEPSVMEDLFESIIGAIYIDSDMDMRITISSVSRLLDVNEYLSRASGVIQSYKNALQELCADKKHRLPPPVYKTLSESGPDHKKVYERAVYIGDKLYAVGVGKNLKIADAIAAEKAFKMFEEREAKKPIAKPAKKNTEISGDPLKKLKEIAQKEKRVSPEFRDKGESLRSNEKLREYQIECRFMGKSAIGIGSDKRSAKENSAEKLLVLLKEEKGEKKQSADSKKHRMKEQRGKEAKPKKPYYSHTKQKRKFNK